MSDAGPVAGEGADRELLTQKQYARRRGWSKQYVHQLVRAGRIVLEGGLIEAGAADAALARDRDPARDPALVAPASNGKSGTEDVSRMPVDVQPPSVGGSFAKARTIREHYRAMREKLEYEELAGRVISRDDVEDAGFRAGAYLRESLMMKVPAIGKALAQRYGIDVREVTDLLEDGVTQVLTAVANELEAEANPFAKPFAATESKPPREPGPTEAGT